jgi:hypothetical protein
MTLDGFVNQRHSEPHGDASGNDPDEQGDDPSGMFHGFWRLI